MYGMNLEFYFIIFYLTDYPYLIFHVFVSELRGGIKKSAEMPFW